MSALPWVLYDQWDGVDFFATEAEALARAASLIEGYLVDEQWNEDVDGIVIARLTHVVGHEDMTPPEGREGEPWFNCVMVPMTATERHAIRHAIPAPKLAEKLRDIAAEVDDGRTERAYRALHDLADDLDGKVSMPENCPLTHGASCLAPACEPRCQLKEI